MAFPDLTNINSFMETRKNQFENRILARFWTTDSYAGLIDSMPFELEMGLTPTIVTATHELPTSYLPLQATSLTLSNGTGNTACYPAVIPIGGGYVNRNFTISVIAFATEVFCLTDLQFKFQWAQQAKFREKGLGDFATQYQGDWHRINMIGNTNAKLSTNKAGGFFETSDSNQNFSGVAGSLPTVALDWPGLGYLYDRLNLIGAQQSAVGNSDGMPVYALTCGPGLKRKLFQTTDFIRTTVNFADEGTQWSRNFLARGIETAINGFIPNVDLNAPRYDAGFNLIYPWINSAATVGTQAVANSAYRTVANGGSAVYEAAFVTARGIYSRRPRPVGPTQAGMEAFNPVNYTGEVRWINNPDMGTNQLGNFGFYRMDIQQAAMPEFPELGFAILTLAIDGT